MKSLKRIIAMIIVVIMVVSSVSFDASAATTKATKATVKSITVTNLPSNTVVIKKNKTFKLKVSVKTTGKASKKVTYKSANTKIATVSSSGKITAKKTGTTKVTIKSVANPKIKKTVKVKVGTPVTKISVKKKTVKLTVGSTYTIKPTITPKKATLKSVTYKSSKPSVAKVSKTGKITAKKAGTARITVKAKDGSGKKVTITVKVSKKKTNKPATTTEDVTTEKPSTTEAATTEKPSTTEEGTTEEDTSKNITQYEGYDLVWNDEFSGETLNTTDWNIEAHEPGWVNAEWQKYVNETENAETGNITVKDGKLVIKPIKTVDEDGSVSYTSGRINTQNKHDFTYGRFEVRAKVPEGQGYLPAFWMMPTDENIYGQWPRCGEIDIMEVMGQDTQKAMGTIHYGNPHGQKQGENILTNGDYSSEYHTYAVDWEPGKITWYIDGQEYFSANDWYSTTVGQGTVAYPAPFDQPFYMILNLAVGGSWVGYPDETTDFENQAFVIDYVRAYQKTDGYDENVEKPEKDITLRAPDENGNYTINGNFAEDDDLSGTSSWKFLTAQSGEATAEIVEDSKFGDGARAVKISTTKAGTVDYSVQFVQANIPLDKGNVYTVSFDAYAATDRTIIVDVSAPDLNYIRYLTDTKVNLTTEKQTFTYTFEMKDDRDSNGRLEFNLGNTSPTSDVYISNVTIKNTDTFEIEESNKPLTDGNYVHNGKFQEGANRMDYWNVIPEDAKGGSYSVTNLADGRRFKITTSDCTNVSDVVLKQTNIPLSANGKYALSFDAELQADDADATKDITVTVAGVEKTFTLKAGKNTFTSKFEIGEILPENTDIEIALGVNATILLDNISIVEDSLIKNGSFNADLSGFEVYAYITSDVSYTVDSQKEDNAFDITIEDTNDAEWKIQLKQDNVTLEKGQWYTLKFDAKSSVDRKIQFAIQRDGSDHKNADGSEDWTPYVQDIASLTSDYTLISKTFQMTEDTDEEAIFNIAMGTVGGRITDQHRICIDNISLEKVDAPEQEEIASGKELITNGDFADGVENWDNYIASAAVATADFTQGKAVYVIENAGENDWDVQLKQAGITLENGATYQLAFTIKSTAARTVKCALLNPSYAWYGGADISLEADETKEVSETITIDKDTSNAITFGISMGKFGGEDTAPSTIEISNVSLKKISGGDAETPGDGDDEEKPEEDIKPGENMLKNADFSKAMANWKETIANWGGDYVTDADSSVKDGAITYNIRNVGTADWHVQLLQEDIDLKAGKTYKVTFEIVSTEARTIISGVQSAKYEQYVDESDKFVTLEQNVKKQVEYTFTMASDDATAAFYFSMGKIEGEDTPASTITISDITLKEVVEE
jgi:beta-glucanase (GH16 family)